MNKRAIRVMEILLVAVLLAILMAVVLVTFTNVQSISIVGAADHNHTVCGVAECVDTNHTGHTSTVDFVDLTIPVGNEIISDGNFYLSANMTLSADLTISANVTLCLAGFVLDTNAHSIIIGETGTLNVCDCTGSTTSSIDGRLVSTVKVVGGTLNMYGGTIYNAVSGWRKGYYPVESTVVGSTINMYGGHFDAAIRESDRTETYPWSSGSAKDNSYVQQNSTEYYAADLYIHPQDNVTYYGGQFNNIMFADTVEDYNEVNADFLRLNTNIDFDIYNLSISNVQGFVAKCNSSYYFNKINDGYFSSVMSVDNIGYICLSVTGIYGDGSQKYPFAIQNLGEMEYALSNPNNFSTLYISLTNFYSDIDKYHSVNMWNHYDIDFDLVIDLQSRELYYNPVNTDSVGKYFINANGHNVTLKNGTFISEMCDDSSLGTVGGGFVNITNGSLTLENFEYQGGRTGAITLTDSNFYASNVRINNSNLTMFNVNLTESATTTPDFEVAHADIISTDPFSSINDENATLDSAFNINGAEYDATTLPASFDGDYTDCWNRYSSVSHSFVEGVCICGIVEHSNHTVCGAETCTDPNHPDHSVVATFEPFNLDSGFLTVSTDIDYYLTDDLVLGSQQINIYANVVLCLNGYTMLMEDNPCQFKVFPGGSLSICDCSADQTGTLHTMASFNSIQVAGGTFNLFGGNILKEASNSEYEYALIDLPKYVSEYYGSDPIASDIVNLYGGRINNEYGPDLRVSAPNTLENLDINYYGTQMSSISVGNIDPAIGNIDFTNWSSETPLSVEFNDLLFDGLGQTLIKADINDITFVGNEEMYLVQGENNTIVLAMDPPAGSGAVDDPWIVTNDYEFQYALNSGKPYIKIANDLALPEPITSAYSSAVGASTDVDIDLDGHTLTFVMYSQKGGTSSLFLVNNGATATIHDGFVYSTMYVDPSYSESQKETMLNNAWHSVLAAQSGAMLNLYNIEMSGYYGAGVILNDANANLSNVSMNNSTQSGVLVSTMLLPSATASATLNIENSILTSVRNNSIRINDYNTEDEFVPVITIDGVQHADNSVPVENLSGEYRACWYDEDAPHRLVDKICEVCGIHSCDGTMEFEPWTYTDQLPTVSGNYYLTGNVGIDSDWVIADGVTINLCIDEYSIQVENAAQIIVMNGGTLNLCECRDKQGYYAPDEGGDWLYDPTGYYWTIGGIIMGWRNENSLITNNGTLSLSNITLINASQVDVYALQNNGDLTIDRHFDVIGNDIAGIYLNNASFTVGDNYTPSFALQIALANYPTNVSVPTNIAIGGGQHLDNFEILSKDGNTYLLRKSGVAFDGEDVVLYKAISVTFDANGGAFAQPVSAGYLAYGDKINEPTSLVVERDNYTMLGWAFTSNGEPISNWTSVKAEQDSVIYAIWGVDAPTFDNYQGFSGEYTGNEHEVGVNANHVLSSVHPLTYSVYKWVDEDWVLQEDINSATFNIKDVIDSGKYKVVATFDDGVCTASSELEFEVTFTKANVQAPSADSTQFVFNGSEQTYSIAGSQLYQVVGNKLTNAGTHTVTVCLNDKNNYTWADGSSADLSFVFTIEKASAIINVDTNPIVAVYGDNITLPTATSNFGSVVCDKVASDIVNAGSYTVTYSVAGTDNYNGATKSVVVTINKATLDLSGITFEDKTVVCNNQVQDLLISGTLPSGVSVNYQGNGNVNAGVYTVVANFVCGDNYNAIEPMSAVLTINHAMLTNNGVSVSVEGGFAPNVSLKVELVEEVDGYNGVLATDESVGAVYRISLVRDGVEVNLETPLQVSIALSEYLQGEEFRLVHFDSSISSDVEYNLEDNKVQFTLSNLGEFVLAVKVVANADYLWIVIMLSVINGVLLISAIILASILRKRKNENHMGTQSLLSIAPLTLGAASMPLGITVAIAVLSVLAFAVWVANIVLIVLIVKERKNNKAKAEALAKAKTEQEKANQENDASQYSVVATPADDRPIVIAPVVASDNDDDDDDDVEIEGGDEKEEETGGILYNKEGEKILVRYNRSFTAKLIQSSDEVKGFYCELHNYLLSFKNVKVRISWKAATLHAGRKQLAKLTIRGKTLKAHFALNPADYQEAKFRVIDMSEVKTYVNVPLTIKVKSMRAVNNAKKLANDLFASLELPEIGCADPTNIDEYPYEETKPLIQRGLIKVRAVNGEDISDIDNLVAMPFTLHESVTVSEAQQEMTDDVALSLVVGEGNINSIGKKFAVNIDTLSKYFKSGDTVTIDALKELGIVPKKEDAIKILARGMLDKTLTVVADSFSADAIKMIVLVGGTAKMKEE